MISASIGSMTDYRTSAQSSGGLLHDENPKLPALSLIGLKATSDAVTQSYQNLVLSLVNDHCLRMAVMEGEYRWHRHPQSDELFIVLEGRLEIDLSAGRTVVLEPGEAIVIPAGTAHRTRAKVRTVNLCFEHQGAYTGVEFLDPEPVP
jgi:mannose-6-phosphate isomerase-like protein (cupin superfamily)